MYALRSSIAPAILHAIPGAALAALGLPSLAWAAILQVSPVRLQFEPIQQAETIQLINDGKDAVQAQVRVMRWTQANGQDQLVPVAPGEMVASPPIMRIEPGNRQIVRVNRPQATAPASELTYRLLIDELPAPSTPQDSGIKVLMRHSIPVFVHTTPTLPAARQRARAATARTDLSHVRTQLAAGQDGKAELRVNNDGPQAIRISALSTVTPGGQSHSVNSGLIGYVLAGQTMSWPLDLAYPLPPSVTLKARFNDDAEAQAVPLGGAGR